MNDLVTEATGVDFYSMRDDFEGAKAKALELNIDGADSARSVGEIINKAFEDKCEASLIQPTFVCEVCVGGVRRVCVRACVRASVRVCVCVSQLSARRVCSAPVMPFI